MTTPDTNQAGEAAEAMPCPFCGEKAEIHLPNVVWGQTRARCTGCLAEEPLDIWNTRAASPATQKEIRNCCIEEDTMAVRDIVSKVRQMTAEDLKDLTECFVAARISDEEAEAATKTIEEILNPPEGRVMLMPMPPEHDPVPPATQTPELATADPRPAGDVRPLHCNIEMEREDHRWFCGVCGYIAPRESNDDD